MAKDKKGFMLYADQKSLFDKLPDDIAGKLIKHIYSYVNDENPKTDDILIEIAFEPIKTQLKRDLKKYNAICERNKENALKRWDKNNATASERIPKDTKNADKDIDKDNGIDKEIDIYKDFIFFKNDFKDIWEKEFIPLKKKKKASITDRALKSQLNKIKKFSNNNYNLALKILEKSVNSGWTDFYELKFNKTDNKKLQMDQSDFSTHDDGWDKT